MPTSGRLLLLHLVACWCAATVAGSALSWQGEFFDPDDLRIVVSKANSNTIVAKSVDWEISGALVSETRARLAGLEGTLDARGIHWSNGVVWSRKAVLEPVAPVGWPGKYHGVLNDVDVTLYETSATKVIAEGRDRHGKTWRADGHISGDTIHMFGLSGRMQGASGEIKWTNNEVWKRMQTAVASPPPPPLLAAGTAGAQPDYWAADFAEHAAHPGDYQRHGALEKQLLLADGRKLYERAKECGGPRLPQMMRIMPDDEMTAADRGGGSREDVDHGVGTPIGGPAYAVYYERAMSQWRAARARVEVAYATAVSMAMGLGKATEVVSAIDDDLGGGAGRNESGRASRDSRDGEMAAAPPISFTGGAEYDWEGEKLSWEVGQGLRPDRLPSYDRDYRISHELDPEEEQC